MTLKKVAEILGCQVISGDDLLDTEVSAGCGCDLMSDVLAFIKSGALLLTGLNNLQVIRTAEMAEIKAICFVRGKMPSQDMIDLAQEKGIVLLGTPLPMYESCGMLFQHGLPGYTLQSDRTD